MGCYFHCCATSLCFPSQFADLKLGLDTIVLSLLLFFMLMKVNRSYCSFVNLSLHGWLMDSLFNNRRVVKVEESCNVREKNKV